MTYHPLEIDVTYFSGQSNDTYSNGQPTVQAGNFIRSYYCLLPTSKAKFFSMAGQFISEREPPGIYVGSYGMMLEKRYRWLGEKLGYKFAQSWNKVMFREWVAPQHELAYKLCYGRIYLTDRHLAAVKAGSVGYDWYLLKQLRDNKALIEQLQRDGTMNIAPFALMSSMTPKGLKSEFGNGIWKKLANNSLSRNKLLAYKFNLIGRAEESVSVLVDAPTHILNIYPAGRSAYSPGSKSLFREFHKAKAERRLGKINKDTVIGMYRIHRDTARMAVQLGERFEDEWSFSRVERLHGVLTNRMHVRQYGTEPFKSICGPGDVSDDNYKLVLLDDPAAIASEGEAMGHCVASYIPSASRGDCSIYSLRDSDDNRISTVEIRPDWIINQHYSKYNSYPPAEVVEWLHEQLDRGEPLRLKEDVMMW